MIRLFTKTGSAWHVTIYNIKHCLFQVPQAQGTQQIQLGKKQTRERPPRVRKNRRETIPLRAKTIDSSTARGTGCESGDLLMDT